MRWRYRSPRDKTEDYIKDMGKWKPFFTWTPVIVDGERIWLERIYRRGSHAGYVQNWLGKQKYYKVKNNTNAWSTYEDYHSVPVFQWQYRSDMLDIIKKTGHVTNDGPDGG